MSRALLTGGMVVLLATGCSAMLEFKDYGNDHWAACWHPLEHPMETLEA